MIDESGVPYKLTSMGTVFETETIDEAFELIKRAYQQLEPDCNRVFSVVKFDIRKGKSNRMVQKIESVESKLKKEVSK
jgi:uncharacterized protein YqgV (UPF0045/DUF77 family)